MSSLLFAQHPFANLPPLQPAIATPLPPTQIRAPARVPPPVIPPRASSRLAAQKNAQERRPVVRQMVASEPPPRPLAERFKDIFSEVRVGAFIHDEGPFSRNEEGGYDANFEVLFVSPNFLDVIWAPRPHLGVNVNSDGDTSQAYLGLTWEWSFFGNWFAGFSLGGAIHDGKLETTQIDRKELGCRVLFRESVEAGYRLDGRHSVSGYLDHISNANLCDRNEGLENFGLRYGYTF
jgi:lipid A 3-O-deacylase